MSRTQLIPVANLCRVAVKCYLHSLRYVLSGAITWHTLDTKSLFSFVLSEVSRVSFY